MQGLLGERVVGWIKLAWHHIHGYGGLEGTRQGELVASRGPTPYSAHPVFPSPMQQQLQQLDFHSPSSSQAAHTQLQEDLIQHFDCLHAGCLGFLGEVLGLGEETQDVVGPSVRL